MELINLKYGESEVEIPIEGAKSIAYITENPMKTIENVGEAFAAGVEKECIGAPLKCRVNADDKITIIISDLTRFWSRQDLICECLVHYLHDNLQVPFDNIKVLVALGTHRKNSNDELRKLASSYVYDNVSVSDHDCDDSANSYVGTTSRGTKVYVNPLCIGRKVIVISSTVHHLMAGYGGGRKSIVPGVASRDTIKANHSWALDPVKAESYIKVGSGLMKDNPVNEDMVEAADFVSPTFGINIVVNSASKLSALFMGDFNEAFRESCKYEQTAFAAPIERKADICIASCGGFPKDINLYQGVKSLFNGVRAVKEGGTLILLAKCSEGGGPPDFFSWIKPLREGRLDSALRADFTIGGYIFYASVEATGKVRVLLLSDIDPEEIKPMGINAYNDINVLLKNIDFGDKDIYVMPYGGSVMPELKEDYIKLNKECEIGSF